MSRKPKKEIRNLPAGRQERDEARLAPRPKRTCFYCDNKLTPTYTDTASLRKFISDRAKIVSKLRTGACSKHQRAITREVKHARHLGLLPFVARI